MGRKMVSQGLGFKVPFLQEIRNWLTRLTVFNRFLFFLVGLILLLWIQFISFFGILKMTHLEVNREKDELIRLGKEVSKIKGGLLQIRYHNDSAEAGETPGKPLDIQFEYLNRIVSAVNRSFTANPEWKNFKQKLHELTELSTDMSRPEASADFQLLQTRAIRSLEKIERQAEVQSNHNQRWIFLRALLLAIGILIVTTIGVVFCSLMLFNEAQDKERKVEFFKSLARKFKDGQLTSETDCETDEAELRELYQAIHEYLSDLKEKYSPIQTCIKDLNFLIKEVALYSRENESVYFQIKQDFKALIDDNFHRLDQFPGLAESIKNLNENLAESQSDAEQIHDYLLHVSEVFKDGPVQIAGANKEITDKGEFLRKIVLELKELRVLLDKLRQTASVFQNVAEQNTLLALNASIEAARAGSTGNEFGLAAEEIALLAEKVNRVSKGLLVIVDQMEQKGNVAVESLEQDFSRNLEKEKIMNNVAARLNPFCEKIIQILNEVTRYSGSFSDFGNGRKSLEEIIEYLARLQQNTETNYGKSLAALDVIGQSAELTASVRQLDEIHGELSQLVAKIKS